MSIQIRVIIGRYEGILLQIVWIRRDRARRVFSPKSGKKCVFSHGTVRYIRQSSVRRALSGGRQRICNRSTLMLVYSGAHNNPFPAFYYLLTGKRAVTNLTVNTFFVKDIGN